MKAYVEDETSFGSLYDGKPLSVRSTIQYSILYECTGTVLRCCDYPGKN